MKNQNLKCRNGHAFSNRWKLVARDCEVEWDIKEIRNGKVIMLPTKNYPYWSLTKSIWLQCSECGIEVDFDRSLNDMEDAWDYEEN